MAIELKSDYLDKDWDRNPIVRVPVEGAFKPQSDPALYKTHVETLILDHNKAIQNRYGAERPIIVFGSYELAHIWLEFGIGQISDGKYENSNIDYEWYWRCFVCVLPGTRSGMHNRGWGPRTKRGLSFKDLTWLFDESCKDYDKNEKGEAVNWRVSPMGVRNIFSHYSTKVLRAMMQEIADAINGRVPLNSAEPVKVLA